MGSRHRRTGDNCNTDRDSANKFAGIVGKERKPRTHDCRRPPCAPWRSPRQTWSASRSWSCDGSFTTPLTMRTPINAVEQPIARSVSALEILLGLAHELPQLRVRSHTRRAQVHTMRVSNTLQKEAMQAGTDAHRVRELLLGRHCVQPQIAICVCTTGEGIKYSLLDSDNEHQR